MAESYSVRAILSATDRGFTSAMRNAQGAIGALGSRVKSGLGFGILAGVGIAAFNGITNSCRSLITDMETATATWKTFTANMQILGKSSGEIKAVEKELSSFAVQTIYDAGQMASTYAQLESVGTKNTVKLVEGFAGLAAAATDPKQAIKTLSQQATQMAARPKVAWMDYKLMLEQTPAGMAAVAREMGISAQEMTSKIQAGELATEDFFAAVEKVGTSDGFSKLARQYKNAGEAMTGFREVLAYKLTPAWDVLSQAAANSIGSIIDSLSKLDREKFAAKLQGFIDKANKYLSALKEDVVEIGSAFGDAFSAISKSLSKLNGAFGSTKSVKGFASAMDVVKNALVGVAGFLKSNAETIAVLIKLLPKLIAAFIGFKILSSLVGGLTTITSLFGNLGDKAEDLGKKSGKSRRGLKSLKIGLNSLMKCSGVAIIIGSIALLAKTLIPLASLGTKAIAPLIAFGAIVAGLGIAFALFGNQLTGFNKKTGRTDAAMKSLKNGFNSFMKSAGIALIITSLALLAAALTPLASLGTTVIAPLVAFGAVVAGLGVIFATFGTKLQAGVLGIIVFAAAVSVMALVMTPLANTGKEGAVAMAAFGVVVAGLVVVFSIFGPALTAAIPAMIALGVAALMVGAGMALACSFIEALPPVIKQLGDTASQVARVVSNAFATICDGAATVVDAISGGVAKVLDSIANVIDSIGTAAANAGTGFERVASGIKTISELSLYDIGKSLGAVAIGMGEIAKSGEGIAVAGSGMQVLVPLLSAAATPATVLGSAFTLLAASSPTLAMGFAAAGAGVAVFNANITSTAPAVLALGIAVIVCSAGISAIYGTVGGGGAGKFVGYAAQCA
ncbi:MAG: tape measure protein, partial [Clostridiales bacterium]